MTNIVYKAMFPLVLQIYKQMSRPAHSIFIRRGLVKLFLFSVQFNLCTVLYLLLGQNSSPQNSPTKQFNTTLTQTLVACVADVLALDNIG